MGPPGGGPVDKRPPSIIRTIPENGSVGVAPEVSIRLRFDEEVNHESLRDAFSLSPPPPGKVTAKWHGKEVVLSFDPPLTRDRTYVLALGTQLKDLRGNPLDETVHLAFSTGETLDQGRISGRLLSETGSVQGWRVHAYFLGGDPGAVGDTAAGPTGSAGRSRLPDPAVDIPDAATQAGNEGEWTLVHLREGRWRVFAFDDLNSDRLWTPAGEPLAVPPGDVMAVEDTLAAVPRLILRGAVHPSLPVPLRLFTRMRDRFEVRFDRKPAEPKMDVIVEELPPEGEGAGSLRIEPGAESPRDGGGSSPYPGSPAALEVASVRYNPADSTVLRVRLAGAVKGAGLTARITGGFGASGRLDTTMTLRFGDVSEVDSFPPSFVLSRPPRGARLHPGRPTVDLVFSEEMSPPPTGGLRVIAPSGDTLAPGWSRPDEAMLRVEFPGEIAGRLRLQLVGALLTDLAGVPLADSLVSLEFIRLPQDSLGTVSGRAEGTGPGEVHLRMVAPGERDLPLEVTAAQGGDFRFPHVPPGPWRIEGWWDRDGNGRWSMGEAAPYVPSDPCTIAPDTVWVRARWETAEVRIIFEL